MQFVHNHPAQSWYAVLVKYQVEVGQEGLADIYISRLKEHCNLYYDLGFRGENDMAWEQPPEDRGLIKCQKGKCRQQDFFIFCIVTDGMQWLYRGRHKE